MWNKLINLYCRQTPEQAVEPVQTEDMDVSKYYTFVAVHCFAGFYPQFVKAPSGAKMHVIDIDKFMLQANTYAAYWTSANWRYGYFQVFYIYTFTLSCWRLNKICKGHISGRYPSNVIQNKNSCWRQTPEQASEPLQTEDMDGSRYCTFMPSHYLACFYSRFLKTISMEGIHDNVIDIQKIFCRQTPENADEPLQTEDMDGSRYCKFVP